MSHNGGNADKIAARQLPQVHIVLLLALQPTVLSMRVHIKTAVGTVQSTT